MKTIITSICMLLAALSFGQGDMHRHFIIGYGAGTNSFTNAYSKLLPAGDLPLDLTTLEFQKERFHHTSFMFKSSFWNESVYVDSDVSYLTTAIVESLRALIKGPEKKQNLAFTGKLRKIDENINATATGIGKQADIIHVDVAAGAETYYFGGSWSISTWGVEDFPTSYQTGSTKQSVFVNAEHSLVNHLGLIFLKGFDNSIGPALASVQVGTMAMKPASNKDLKRRGLEVRTALKIYSEQDPGLYLEAFYRYQRFKKFERPANWNRNSNGENGIAPQMVAQAIGFNVGFYFSY